MKASSSAPTETNRATSYPASFYRVVHFVGSLILGAGSKPTILRPELTECAGGYLLASNHISPYDVPCLIRHCRRHIDFLSLTEVFEKPLVGAFFSRMNAVPLARSSVIDRSTLRQIVRRLRVGRVVGIFPEGHIAGGLSSVIIGGTIEPGLGQLAKLGHVPILPAAVLGTGVFSHFKSWLPLRSARYGVAFGEPFDSSSEGVEDINQRWCAAVRALAHELTAEMSKR